VDPDQLTGIGVVLLGISAMSSAVTTVISSTAPYSFIMPAGMAIAGLCLSGMGAGILMGKFETRTGTASKRSTALIATIAIVAFGIGAVLALS
jgi:NhaP-type Na+/H+ or K+/H+ antiporter